jgi:endoglycosylceramidase
VALVLAVPALAPAGAPAAWPPREPYGAAGRWIVDADGRVLVPHGLNLTDKRPPYLPQARGWSPEVARWMRRQGFTAIRLGWILKGLAPVRGEVDERYLDGVERAVRIATDAGLLVLVDLHQDYFNERTGGEGFPDWMTPLAGPPPKPWNLAFDTFWATRGWHDATASAWERVARRLARVPGILGHDLLNEPYPGGEEGACARYEGCPRFDDEVLDPFFATVGAGARRGDPARLVFAEPHVIFNAGAASSVDAPASGASGFSFHAYCEEGPGLPPCAERRGRAFDNAEAVARRTGMALLMTEFGATDDLAEIDRVARLADERMVPWMAWALWNHDPFAARPHEGLLRDLDRGVGPANVKQGKLEVLARPHPRAVAGTPLAWSWDRVARVFEARWSPAGVRGPVTPGALTEVELPPVAFPRGWRATVRGGAVVPGGDALRVRATGTGEVRLRVQDAGPGPQLARHRAARQARRSAGRAARRALARASLRRGGGALVPRR